MTRIWYRALQAALPQKICYSLARLCLIAWPANAWRSHISSGSVFLCLAVIFLQRPFLLRLKGPVWQSDKFRK